MTGTSIVFLVDSGFLFGFIGVVYCSGPNRVGTSVDEEQRVGFFKV